jgi:predicted transcriptional regulator
MHVVLYTSYSMGGIRRKPRKSKRERKKQRALVAMMGTQAIF